MRSSGPPLTYNESSGTALWTCESMILGSLENQTLVVKKFPNKTIVLRIIQ